MWSIAQDSETARAGTLILAIWPTEAGAPGRCELLRRGQSLGRPWAWPKDDPLSVRVGGAVLDRDTSIPRVRDILAAGDPGVTIAYGPSSWIDIGLLGATTAGAACDLTGGAEAAVSGGAAAVGGAGEAIGAGGSTAGAAGSARAALASPLGLLALAGVGVAIGLGVWAATRRRK